MLKTKDYKRQNNNSAALLNVDNTALASYKQNRENMRKLGGVNERMDKIEESIEEIKELLKAALGKK